MAGEGQHVDRHPKASWEERGPGCYRPSGEEKGPGPGRGAARFGLAHPAMLEGNVKERRVAY